MFQNFSKILQKMFPQYYYIHSKFRSSTTKVCATRFQMAKHILYTKLLHVHMIIKDVNYYVKWRIPDTELLKQ